MAVDEQAINLSVQEQEPPSDYGGGSFWVVPAQGDLLPAYGSPDRDYQLRKLWYRSIDTVAGGAFAGFVKRIQGTPHEIKGGRNLARHFSDVFQNAQFGQGWDVFLPRVLTDYLTQDKGAFIELIGRGNPLKPLKGAVEGIAHLDAGRCVLTGNDEFPVVYSARRTGKLHRLHWTRVVHLVDSPDADEIYFNAGHCALSRLVSVSTLQWMINRYQIERLSDLPPTGFLTISGVNDGQYMNALELYNAGRTQEANNIFRNIFRITGIDPDKEVKVNFIPFSTLPEHFNYREFVELHVNMIALALGVDVQEIWQLGGGALGSGAQSKVLSEKSRGKGYGHLLQMLERVINIAILPDSLEFKFKFQDSEQEAAEATRAQVWVSVASSAPALSDEQRLQLLANNVQAFADVLLDEDGQIKLPDVDRKPVDEVQQVVTEDAATLGTEQDASTVADDTPAPDQQESAAPPPAGRVQRDRRGSGVDRRTLKALQSTRLDFEGDLEDMLAGAAAGEMTRGRAGIVLRALVAKYGRLAYKDGLADGGITAEPSDDDVAAMNAMIREQSAYVAGVLDTLYQDGLTEAEIAGKPDMWWRGSMLGFYQQGLLAAGDDPLMEFGGPDGEESCDTCQRLKGQKHRLSEYIERNLSPQPGMDSECGGWKCSHRLDRTTGSEEGDW